MTEFKTWEDVQAVCDKVNAAEKPYVEMVLKVGAEWGYGNMIHHLKKAWKEDLIKSGLAESTAELGSRLKHKCEKCGHTETV